jgi:hypothetical protein
MLASAKTDLKEAAVFPDSYSKMDVQLAKAPFTLKTLSENTTFIQEELGYGMPAHLPDPKDVLLETISTQHRRSIFHGGLTARVSELKRIATFDANQSSDDSKMHTSEFCQRLLRLNIVATYMTFLIGSSWRQLRGLHWIGY